MSNYFESDHTQPKSRIGTMEERCINCGQEYNDHTNGQCPEDDDDAEGDHQVPNT